MMKNNTEETQAVQQASDNDICRQMEGWEGRRKTHSYYLLTSSLVLEMVSVSHNPRGVFVNKHCAS